jgi:hypothetical protein
MRLVTAPVLALLLFSIACHRDDDAVNIRVFLNGESPFGDRVNRALLTVSSRLAAQHRIRVSTIVLDSNRYHEFLSSSLQRTDPQVVVFDSANDRVRSGLALSTEVSLCGSPESCVGGIPPWVRAGERSSAELVLKELCSAMKK